MSEPHEITVEAFYEKIRQENNIFLIDTRNDEEYKTWQIESRYTPETWHIFYSYFFDDDTADETLARVPRDKEIIVLCAKGGASDFVAAMLEEEGIPAKNLVGGMIAWGNLYVFNPIVENGSCEIYQVDRVARGCLSYILISDGQAVIIDPLRHVEKYQKFLSEKGATVSLILDTHGHADHISGGPALSAATGAPYYLHPYDGIHPFDMVPARIDYQMLFDGQSLSVGNLDIKVIHVPGHTLGQVNFLVTDPDGGTYLFTGDNIFIQSFGRPDLGGQGQAWAPMVYETIFEKVKENVPADALMLPGHYAQPDEANSDGVFTRPLSTVWSENHDLQDSDPNNFVNFVLNNLPKLPEQYIEIKRVNAGLVEPNEQEASELELGKNICALTTAY